MCEGLGDEMDSGDGFFDFAVCAVDGCEVAICAVTAVKDWTAAQGSFGGDEDIVAVDEDRFRCQAFWWDLGLEAVLQLGVGAGPAHNS